MNEAINQEPAARPAPTPATQPKKKRPAPADARPVLEKLFQFHPGLFGAQFLPLKLGIFEDLMNRHPGVFTKDELKAALGHHVRSTRYLDAVAAGQPRCDLDAQPVEPVAPEHRLHAIVEVLRRRQAHTKNDLRPWATDRVLEAIEASGLDREAFATLVPTQDATTLALLDAAWLRRAEQSARHEALRRAYEASGKPVAEFAQMYGLDEAAVHAALDAASGKPSDPPLPG